MITHSFGIVNYLVLFGYLRHDVSRCLFFQTAKTADDYFRGGGRVRLGGWGQCICYYVKLNYIYVNSCQSVYFRLDVYHWSVSGYRNFTAGFLFLYSVFRKLKVTSAYEYLEARFDVRCRLFASMSFMLFHIGRIAIITFLTVLALRPSSL